MQSPTTVTVSLCYDIGEMFIPKVHLHGCQRSCEIEYLHSSFVCSKKEDAVYCINCALFLPTDKRRALGSFVNTGYKGWNNIHKK